ncbi:mechanosensitive ion channel [Edaphobacter sp. 4G125]|nr:mechanosensitive ion channel [Edaphobacter sp. 4G125]
MEYLPFLQARKGNWTGEYVARGIVDQRPWQTAATLSALAQSAEEREFAREAERLADHEVDQAFSQSLRQASLEKPKLTGRALELQQKVNQLQETLKNDQARIASLTTGTKPEDASSNASDIEIAKAQLGLDQNSLDDALENLARESGDQRSKIQQELTARQAAMKKYASDTASRDEGQNAVASAEQYTTLAGQLSALRSLSKRRQLITQAEQLANADVAALTGDQTRLQSEYGKQSSASSAPPSRSERIEQLQRMAAQQNILSILGDRLNAQQQLVTLYGRWGKQVEIQRRIVIHLLLQSLAIIAAICVLTLLAGWALQLALERIFRDRRQKHTLQTVLNLGTQLIGLLLVLLVVFGVPRQTPTILGLATAGLTVVFQDFILAFCGWFVLMGPNGIRVRDWVEINGVGGEVVELGIFRTWLLETGNWTANGHPTGRRVSFLNGYAIRGKYFNFSTVGQWMWDEVKVNIPSTAEIHPLIEKIYEATVEATQTDAKMAESEWKRVTHEEGSPQFSAMPSVNLRPAGTGVDIVVRYITRAGLRLEKRNQLFETILDLMQKGSNRETAQDG